MKAKAWALASYGLNILFLLATMLFKERDILLLVSFLLMLNLANLLTLLRTEKEWDATHYLALALLMLTAIFTILYLIVPLTGVTYLYGAVLILATMALLVVEIIAGWRGYTVLNRLIKQEKRHEEPSLEPVMPYKEPERFLAKQGSTIYHLETCRALQQSKVADLITLTEDEALAYEMTPCKICNPDAQA